MDEIIDQNILNHSKAVAEVMYDFSQKNKEEMYVLGLLHDVGKIYGFADHEKRGAELMKSMGFKYSNEILYHGKAQDEYCSEELDILNAADLSVDSHGIVVGFHKRVNDIGDRYGYESTEYLNAMALSKKLEKILSSIEKMNKDLPDK